MERTPVDLFLEARPYYQRAHVEDIARYTAEEGIPFCEECWDWHYEDEEHSS